MSFPLEGSTDGRATSSRTSVMDSALSILNAFKNADDSIKEEVCRLLNLDATPYLSEPGVDATLTDSPEDCGSAHEDEFLEPAGATAKDKCKLSADTGEELALEVARSSTEYPDIGFAVFQAREHFANEDYMFYLNQWQLAGCLNLNTGGRNVSSKLDGAQEQSTCVGTVSIHAESLERATGWIYWQVDSKITETQNFSYMLLSENDLAANDPLRLDKSRSGPLSRLVLILISFKSFPPFQYRGPDAGSKEDLRCRLNTIFRGYCPYTLSTFLAKDKRDQATINSICVAFIRFLLKQRGEPLLCNQEREREILGLIKQGKSGPMTGSGS